MRFIKYYHDVYKRFTKYVYDPRVIAWSAEKDLGTRLKRNFKTQCKVRTAPYTNDKLKSGCSH